MAMSIESWIMEASILIMLEDSDNYGYKIIKSNKLQVSDSTIWPILKRLTKQGYLETYTQVHDSRLRKYYALTLKGREQIVFAKKRWKEYKEICDELLKEEIITG